MKIIIVVVVIIVILVGFYIFTRWGEQNIEDANIEHISPDTAKTNNPILVEVVFSTKKSDKPINTLFTNILLHYKLTTENNYLTANPIQAPLSPKYQNMNNDMKYEQYNFFLPLYPVGTNGEIEYYIDVMFDGKSIRSEGPKKIILVD